MRYARKPKLAAYTALNLMHADTRALALEYETVIPAGETLRAELAVFSRTPTPGRRVTLKWWIRRAARVLAGGGESRPLGKGRATGFGDLSWAVPPDSEPGLHHLYLELRDAHGDLLHTQALPFEPGITTRPGVLRIPPPPKGAVTEATVAGMILPWLVAGVLLWRRESPRLGLHLATLNALPLDPAGAFGWLARFAGGHALTIAGAATLLCRDPVSEPAPRPSLLRVYAWCALAALLTGGLVTGSTEPYQFGQLDRAGRFDQTVLADAIAAGNVSAILLKGNAEYAEDPFFTPELQTSIHVGYELHRVIGPWHIYRRWQP